jgi:undecaprenyl-diphosphatase
MDAAVLLWIHRHASPPLDSAFLFSNELGTLTFCAALVLAAAVWHLARRERWEAVAWVAVGVATWVLPELVKVAVGRPRPTLWPWLVPASGLSFPSGHAVAGTAFYPLLGWTLGRGRPAVGRLAYALGLVPAAFVGVGRLYLGVHWPTDVLAGWALGAALSGGAIFWLTRKSAVRRTDLTAAGRLL